MKQIEVILERFLFASRWLMAPMYVGMSISLLLLFWAFLKEMIELIAEIPHITANDVTLGVLGLIDLSLTANLVMIVLFSGYQNFVSKMDIDEDHVDRPDWWGKVDFSSLKMKLISSMVAISGIHLLKVFMQIENVSREHLIGMIALHFAFVISGVLLALMDYVSAKADSHKTH